MRRWTAPIAVSAVILTLTLVVQVSEAVWVDPTSNSGNVLSTDTLLAPSGLGAALSGADVQLNWTATASTFASGYNVYRSTTSGSGYTLIGATVGRLTTNYLDVAPPIGQTYYYVVQATIQNWTSAFSNEASETVPGTLEPPTILVASPGAGTDVDLAWTAPVDVTATGYQVYRSTSALTGYALVATVVGRLNTTHTDSPPAAETTYFYVVDATYGGGDSDFSNYAARAVLASVADAEVREDDANDNRSTGSDFDVKSEVGGIRRGFIRFDVTIVPATATVNTARVSLFLSEAPIASRTIELQRSDAAWVESTITWNSQPGATGTIVTAVTGTTALLRNTWTVTADVASFLTGALTNDGWRLRDQSEDDDDGSSYRTKEHSVSAEKPQLLVFYAMATIPVKP